MTTFEAYRMLAQGERNLADGRATNKNRRNKLALFCGAYSAGECVLSVAKHLDEPARRRAGILTHQAFDEMAKMCGIENPTAGEAAAIGAGAGALLLGPLGAVAGGYLGAKKGGKKKAAKKKNPDGRRERRRAMSKLLRGT